MYVKLYKKLLSCFRKSLYHFAFPDRSCDNELILAPWNHLFACFQDRERQQKNARKLRNGIQNSKSLTNQELWLKLSSGNRGIVEAKEHFIFIWNLRSQTPAQLPNKLDERISVSQDVFTQSKPRSKAWWPPWSPSYRTPFLAPKVSYVAGLSTYSRPCCAFETQFSWHVAF